METKAVKLSPERPFLWASGWHSPIYCDNRKLLSYPSIRKDITAAFVSVITENFKKRNRKPALWRSGFGKQENRRRPD